MLLACFGAGELGWEGFFGPFGSEEAFGFGLVGDFGFPGFVGAFG